MASTAATPAVLPEPEVNVSVDQEHKILGLTMSEWVKVVAFVIVLVIVASVIAGFRSISNSPAMKNLSDAFGSATSALAFCASNWYLILGALIIGPMVPSAGKWVADKVSDGAKSGLKGKELEAYTDIVINYKAKEQAADTSRTPDERAKSKQDANDSADRWDNYSDDEKDRAREEAKKNGFPDPTPIK